MGADQIRGGFTHFFRIKFIGRKHTVPGGKRCFHAHVYYIGICFADRIVAGMETPFSARYSMLSTYKLDAEKMRKAASYLVGTHDYSSFVAERKNIDDAVRTIYDIRVQDFGNFRCITFIGNGFLYKMVRNLVGTLYAAGNGTIQPEDAGRILAACDRTVAPDTAPAHGLFLMKVFFEPDDPNSFQLEQVPFFM